MKIEISIHATQLKNVAGTFKGTSDPFAVVTQIATTPGSTPHVLGKTEVVKNSLSPQWTRVFEVDYELGTPVKVAVNVFDENTKKSKSNKGMGSALFDIAECLGARGNTKARKLRKGSGTLFLSVRPVQGSGTLRLKLKASKLKNVEDGMFSKSDPFFEISRKVNAAGSLTWDNVYRSAHVKSNLNPEWGDAAVISLSTLCGGDIQNGALQIAVYDYESSGKHHAMGHVETTVAGLQNSSSPMKLMQKGKEVGMLHVVSAEVSGVVAEGSNNTNAAAAKVTEQMAAATISAPTPTAPSAPVPAATTTSTFVPGGGAAVGAAVGAGRGGGSPNFIDYISGGCDLNVAVAIDFTGSNGDPRQPGTLHHLHANGQLNDYEKAISAIVSILGKYDSDQQYPVYGFGAKYGGIVRHCFQCGPTAEVHGTAGVLAAYRQVFASGLIMSGPTNFCEVLTTVAHKARSAQDAAARNGNQQAYTVLLILTDGAVSDVPATAECLKQISDSPLSVVIVGVGAADFGSMQFLDDVSAGGAGRVRDIAQFVEFNKHSSNSVALTSETLHEVPEQLTGYFQSKGIAPCPALTRSDSMMSIDDSGGEDEIDLTLDITGEDEIVVTGGGQGFVDGFAASR